MRKLIGGLTLALAVAFATPAIAEKPVKADKTEKASKTDAQKAAEHMKLRGHIAKKVKYPASKEDVVASITKAKIKADDVKWLTETLPSGNYETADDVMKALGWDVAPPAEKASK